MISLDTGTLAAYGLFVALIIICVAGIAYNTGRERGRHERQRQYEQMADLKRRYLIHRR